MATTKAIVPIVGNQFKFYSFGGFFKIEITSVIEKDKKYSVKLLEILDNEGVAEEVITMVGKLIKSGESFPIQKNQLLEL